MADNSRPLPSSSRSTSGDAVILLVFFVIGTILFGSFARGFISLGQGSVTETPNVSAIPSKEIQLTITRTPSASATASVTSTLPIASETVTPLNHTSAPSKTSSFLLKTSTPVPYKSSTPVNTKIPKTNTPIRTSTYTPTPTVTVTSTITTTVTPVNACITAEPGTGLPVIGDTWIDANEPTVNHGLDELLSLRADNNGDKRILLKFDLSSLSGASVSSAKLYFYINSASGATIYIYSVSRYWEGKEATWKLAETLTAWTNEGGDYNHSHVASVITTADCRVQVDLSTLVQDWSTTNPNQGIILIASGTAGEISIPSSRATSVANRPVLLVVTVTPTVTVTSTITITPTITLTPTITVTSTSTSTNPPTITATVTSTTTLTPTSTPTLTATVTLTPTLTETGTP